MKPKITPNGTFSVNPLCQCPFASVLTLEARLSLGFYVIILFLLVHFSALLALFSFLLASPFATISRALRTSLVSWLPGLLVYCIFSYPFHSPCSFFLHVHIVHFVHLSISRLYRSIPDVFPMQSRSNPDSIPVHSRMQITFYLVPFTPLGPFLIRIHTEKAQTSCCLFTIRGLRIA